MTINWPALKLPPINLWNAPHQAHQGQAMTDKLKGAFRGCPHHGDEYEDCIQYSGTAPCGVAEDREAWIKADAMEWVLAQSINDENDGALWRSHVVAPEINRLRAISRARND